MALFEKKLWWAVVLVTVVISRLQLFVVGAPLVPCYFIFGDSSADNGNNNPLPTLAKSNYSPYGIDFPDGPTGRFTNGATVVDFIAELLGFDNFIPAFASENSDTFNGVNYASASSGIRDETGDHLGIHVSMNKQLENHQVIINRIASDLSSNNSATQHLNKCLYSVGIGVNDYINNYFLPHFYNTSQQYRPQQYAQVLMHQFSHQLKSLYANGARKIAIFGLVPAGCTPYAIANYPRNGAPCVDSLNNAVQRFNDNLKSLVDQLNANLTDAKLILLNLYGISSSANGLKVLNETCCPVKNSGVCDPNKAPCENRREYRFWDGFHPTAADNQITAKRSFIALDSLDVYPFDISNLVQN